jgi:hypothetical protein
MLVAALLGGAAPAAAAEKRIGLTSFDRIVLNGDFVVEVVTRSPLGAVVSGSSEGLDRVEIVNSGGVLTISDRRFASNRQRGPGAGAVTIRINAASLRGASVAGAGSLTIDRIRGARADLSLRGPGTLMVGAVTADRLTLAMTGNGRVQLAGTAKSTEAQVSGAGVVDAAALAATDLNVSGEGTADQRYQASRTAALTLRGQGRLIVSGKAKCTIRNLGSGTVQCGE